MASYTPHTHIPPPVCQISYKFIHVTDPGHSGCSFSVWPFSKDSCQPFCEVHIFVHQGADTALLCTCAVWYRVIVRNRNLCSYLQLRGWLLCVCAYSRCHFEISLSLYVFVFLPQFEPCTNTKFFPLHTKTKKTHKLVFPKTSAWANYWALVREVVLLSSLASLEQNTCSRG